MRLNSILGLGKRPPIFVCISCYTHTPHSSNTSLIIQIRQLTVTGQQRLNLGTQLYIPLLLFLVSKRFQSNENADLDTSIFNSKDDNADDKDDDSTSNL